MYEKLDSNNLSGSIAFILQTLSNKTSVKKPEIKREATAKGMTVNVVLLITPNAVPLHTWQRQ